MKRLGLTLPDSVHGRLEVKAEAQGRPLAELARWMVEYCLHEDIPNFGEPEPTQKQNGSKGELALQFLLMLSEGKCPANGELVKMARDIGIDAEILASVRDAIATGRDCRGEVARAD